MPHSPAALGRLPALLLACLALLLAACGDGDGPAAEGSDGATASAPSDVEHDLTWYRDIAPMMDRHCNSCHYDGGQGTGDFTDPTMVRDFAPAIVASVEAGRMPPPASDPECREYIGHDRWVVGPEFNQQLQDWLDDGAPLGDPDTRVEVPPLEMRLTDPNLEVRIPRPYRPSFNDPRNPGNEYRCFVVEHGRDETFYIRSMAPVIDREELVHHIVLFKARRDEVPAHDDWNTGYDCIDMTFFLGSGGAADLLSGESGMISAWAPGSQAIHFAENTGIRMDPHHVFIMQMHYFDGSGGAPEPDLSGYEFITAESARSNIIMAPFGPTGFRIPPGAESHAEQFTVDLPLRVRLHGVMPHMHYLGQSYRMWYRHRNTDHCIVESDRYDFDNQLTYMFEEPLRIPLGSQIGFGCTWNNSTSNPNLVHNPPITVGYGERTDEEMCFGFSLISFD